MSESELVKRNHQRAQEIVDSWPSWKREFSTARSSSDIKEINKQGPKKSKD